MMTRAEQKDHNMEEGQATNQQGTKQMLYTNPHFQPGNSDSAPSPSRERENAEGYYNTICKTAEAGSTLLIIHKRVCKTPKYRNLKVFERIDIPIGAHAQKSHQAEVTNKQEPGKKARPGENKMDDLLRDKRYDHTNVRVHSQT
jgi:hypothetical protein